MSAAGMIPLIVIRPQPGCAATVAAAQERGFAVHGFPLFRVAPLAWDAPARGSFDALLIGSANAVRQGGRALAGYAGAPAYVVGAATAEAARAAGLNVVSAGSGGLQAVLGQVQPGHARLLRLAGRERIELDLPAGITMTERIVYASEPDPMPLPLRGLLGGPALVLLHSAEAARHFARLCDDHQFARSGIALAAMGPRIAAAAGTGWAALATAATPDDAALLALADRMCQNSVRLMRDGS